MDFLYYASMPLIGAAIGWVTNWVAVKLLFRPQRPIHIPGYTFQGVVPKRRDELASSIGQVVENELLSVEDLLEALRCGDTMDRIAGAVSRAIKARIMDRMPAFIPGTVKRSVSDIITDQLRSDIPAVLEESLDRFGATISETVSFRAIVEEKVNGYSLDRLEQLVLSVAAKELKHIEILGGVLGFIIGLAQAGILYFFVLGARP